MEPIWLSLFKEDNARYHLFVCPPPPYSHSIGCNTHSFHPYKLLLTTILTFKVSYLNSIWCLYTMLHVHWNMPWFHLIFNVSSITTSIWCEANRLYNQSEIANRCTSLHSLNPQRQTWGEINTITVDKGWTRAVPIFQNISLDWTQRNALTSCVWLWLVQWVILEVYSHFSGMKQR